MKLVDTIKEKAKLYHSDIVNWRRTIHANPELAFEEYQTAEFIASKLNEWDIPFTSGVAKTGIVALISGKPGGSTIALRGDMDALPILEENEVPYKSTQAGKMHACGHDVHTAALLGATKILNDIKTEFTGNIKLIFQPSEEKWPGGASLMIAEGVLENPKPQSIFGQHVYPMLPAGKVGFRPGMYMASADEIYITVKGKGGHAALPQNNIDPIVIAAHLITSLQQVVSRHANPFTPSVLSFGKIAGGATTNVIPDTVELAGTFRTMDEDWRKKAHTIIKDMATQLCQSMGGTCDIDIKVGYPFLKNDEALTARAKAAAITYLGAENVVDLGTRMTAEDFAYYTQHMPACFYRLGTASPNGSNSSPVHTPTFDIDETALETASGLMAYLAVGEMG